MTHIGPLHFEHSRGSASYTLWVSRAQAAFARAANWVLGSSLEPQVSAAPGVRGSFLCARATRAVRIPPHVAQPGARSAAATYRPNHPNVKLYERDIGVVSPKRLLRALNLPEGKTVDLIAGCPPCQGFTRLTDSKGGRDRRNGLVRQFLRFVRAIRLEVT